MKINVFLCKMLHSKAYDPIEGYSGYLGIAASSHEPQNFRKRGKILEMISYREYMEGNPYNICLNSFSRTQRWRVSCVDKLIWHPILVCELFTTENLIKSCWSLNPSELCNVSLTEVSRGQNEASTATHLNCSMCSPKRVSLSTSCFS